MKSQRERSSELRSRILACVGALVLLCLVASIFSLYRITRVNASLDAINRIVVPLNRLMTQMKTDGEILQREMIRRVGYVHWQDNHWSPQPIPNWINEVLDRELERARELISDSSQWATPADRSDWKQWIEDVSTQLLSIRKETGFLYGALQNSDQKAAFEIYPRWNGELSAWVRKLHWGVSESERILRGEFAQAQSRVSDLRMGLQAIVIVVVFLSFLLLWLGERALRPLAELTRLAREIAGRGLRKEDKSELPQISLSRNDEVSQLAREFHRMATSLLEREKTVEDQNTRLEEQNKLLKKMGLLQKRLQVAENLAAVGRMSAQVAHEVRNPLHSIGLEAEVALEQIPSKSVQAKQSLLSILASVERLEKITENYLKLSRLSLGQKQKVDLGEILESVLATYTSLFESHGIRVDWKREAKTSLAMWGDQPLLEQAFGNLLRNAVQALEGLKRPEGWKPTIQWTLGQTESGKIWIRIEDNGDGIPVDVQPRLFTPFFTTRAQGTGLGLSFVQKVIHEHGGEIQYVSRPLGEGACFDMFFPVNEVQQQPVSEPLNQSEIIHAPF